MPGSCGSPARDVLVDGLQDRDALVVPGARQQHPGRRGAALAGMHQRADADEARGVEVGVLQDDGRRLAAEFEEQPLHRRGALLHDPLADGRGAGERDHVDLRRQRELFADEVVRRRHHVHHTGGDIGLLGDESAEPRGVERSIGCGLEHHGVTGRQRLGELVDGDLEREIPRHDRTDHPDRFVPDLARGVHAGDGYHGVAEIGFPREGFDQPGRIQQTVFEGCVQLRPVRHRARCTHLRDEFLAQLLEFTVDRLV